LRGKNMSFFKLKGTDDESYLPEVATIGSAGYDLKTTRTLLVPAHETVIVPTGVELSIPNNMVGIVTSRSGIALNKGLIVLNAPGVIDADFKDEIHIILHNISKVPQAITEGDRIAQILVIKHEAKSGTKTRNGGFGSTG